MNKTQRDEFLQRAKDAEDLAARAVDEAVRHGWEQIAEGYRALAQVAETQSRPKR